MLSHNRQKIVSEIDDLLQSERHLLFSEARALAHLVMDTYFPSLSEADDVTCWNCQSYISRVCIGKGLDFNDVIECLVNRVMCETSAPDQFGSSSEIMPD